MDDEPPPLEAIPNKPNPNFADDDDDLPPLEMEASDEPPALEMTTPPASGTPAPAAETDAEAPFVPNDDEPTMQEIMMAEANKARQAKQEKQAKERKQMDKSFGTGMNLKEAFKKNPKKKKEIVIEFDDDDSSEEEEEDVVELGAEGFDISDTPEPQEELPLDHPDLKEGITLKEEGNSYFKNKEYAAAIMKYKCALEAFPDNAPTSLKSSLFGNSATCAYYRKEYEKAIQYANSALNLDKKYAKALYRRGLAQQALGELDVALKDLKKALKLDLGNKTTQKAVQVCMRKIKEKEMPTITKKATSSKEDGLRLEEVQEAMRGAKPATDFLKEKQNEWSTPELMEKMRSNPRIVAGMKNPYYMKVMQELQSNPQEAMRKCQSDPGLRDFIQEWVGMMGGHFDKLGKKEEEEKKQKKQEEAKKAVGTNPITGKEIRWDNLPEEAKDQKADEQVQKILGTPELAALLNDPEMHKVLQDCGNPGRLGHYMRDPQWGPKLRMMADAGLVQIQR